MLGRGNSMCIDEGRKEQGEFGEVLAVYVTRCTGEVAESGQGGK